MKLIQIFYAYMFKRSQGLPRRGDLYWDKYSSNRKSPWCGTFEFMIIKIETKITIGLFITKI